MMTYNYSSASSCDATLPGPSLQSLCSAAEYICFMTALENAIQNNPNISQKCERIKSIDEPDEEYDFIVAGGGGGGAVVAGRLAEISDWKTLVLEAGEDESAAGQIPGFFRTLIGAEIDWNYYTSNESYACLSANGSCYWSSARSLGGNTAHNGMTYLRGNPTDYNKWADMGNYGWEWDEVLKHYKNQEDNANIDEVGYKYHGTGGPLSVGRFSYVPEFLKLFLKASEQSGFGVSKDLNGKNLTGFTYVQATQKNGVRVSSASAFLRPQRNRKNLHVSLNSYVTKIIIENNVAVGVEFMKDGKLRSVRAKKEVIVSMGTARSPQMLLLSGIGPKEHLKSHGIDVILDLPGVGENLHDHVSYKIELTVNASDTYENDVRVAREYLKNQTGPMSVGGEVPIVGIGSTNRTTPNYPDLQIHFAGNAANCAPGKVGALRSNAKRLVKTCTVVNVHPKSRGRISLASNDPFEYPVMWGNYLSEESDIDVIIDGIEILLDILKAEALKQYDFQLSITPPEACANYTMLTRQYWTCLIRQASVSEWHQVGTCKMGPASDSMAVVDPELRVHGIKNLRVVDASIMPQVTSANTGAPTMMIGERGANFIKKTWLPSSKWPGDVTEDC